MKKMNKEMRSRDMTFIARDIDGGGNVAWAQWLAKTPIGDIEGLSTSYLGSQVIFWLAISLI